MVDYSELMQFLSRPRPNGSRALAATARALRGWLDRHGISHRIHTYTLYPFFFEAIGIWILLSRTLLAVAVWLRWGWPALVIALISLPVGLVDVALKTTTLARLKRVTGENILIEFEPEEASQELILCAHYDSKTELLDHRQRMFFIKNLRLGILLTGLAGLLGALDGWLLGNGSGWAGLAYGLGLLATLPLLFLAWGLGLNLSTGRLLQPSQGAVDNGVACAVLLGLADLLNKELRLAQTAADFRSPLRRTRLTLAIFSGEEVNMQGSRAYTRDRDWPLTTAAVNLEVLAQDGAYVLWEQDGSALRLEACSPKLNELVVSAVRAVTGQSPRFVGPLNSDGSSFLAAGVPATTMGTYHSRLVDTGFHRPTDNLDRVVMERIPEGVEILVKLIQLYDRSEPDQS
jgi:hypothetical protein